MVIPLRIQLGERRQHGSAVAVDRCNDAVLHPTVPTILDNDHDRFVLRDRMRSALRFIGDR